MDEHQRTETRSCVIKPPSLIEATSDREKKKKAVICVIVERHGNPFTAKNEPDLGDLEVHDIIRQPVKHSRNA